jgi:hypothetical protein
VARAAPTPRLLVDRERSRDGVLRCCLEGDGRRFVASFCGWSGVLDRRVEDGRRRQPLRSPAQDPDADLRPVTLGTLGRVWDGPSTLLSHLDVWGTAAVAAATSVLVNNLPAASLLAARIPDHPFALLIGLNLGPKLFVTGSLAWILWLRSARGAGAHPSVVKASRIGGLAVPLSMAAALGVLVATGVT